MQPFHVQPVSISLSGGGNSTGDSAFVFPAAGDKPPIVQVMQGLGTVYSVVVEAGRQITGQTEQVIGGIKRIISQESLREQMVSSGKPALQPGPVTDTAKR